MKSINRILISVLIVLLFAGTVQALPNASFTINRTQGYIGQVSQSVLFTDTSTRTGSITTWNLSLDGTNWYNSTNWAAGTYAFAYSTPGNYTPNLTVTMYYGGTNLSTSKMINVTYPIYPSFICSRPGGDLNKTYNLNGTRPFTVVCNSTGLSPVSVYDWYGTGISTNQTTGNISTTYTSGGYKNVNLIISNGNGTNVSYSGAHYIWVMKSSSPQEFDPSPQGIFGGFWQWLMDFFHDIFGGSG